MLVTAGKLLNRIILERLKEDVDWGSGISATGTAGPFARTRDVKNVFYVFYKSLKNMFCMFFYFSMFFVLF